MKNGNMPAAPVHEIIEHCGFDGSLTSVKTECVHAGLSKREHFAGIAPQVPLWFERVFQFEEFNSPLSDEEWQVSAIYRREDYGHKDFNKAMDLNSKYMTAHNEYEQKKEIARYFAWRTFYSDALLAELEKQNEA